jgi:hypothetical protein
MKIKPPKYALTKTGNSIAYCTIHCSIVASPLVKCLGVNKNLHCEIVRLCYED